MRFKNTNTISFLEKPINEINLLCNIYVRCDFILQKLMVELYIFNAGK